MINFTPCGSASISIPSTRPSMSFLEQAQARLPAADRRSGRGAATGLAGAREFAAAAGIGACLFRCLLDVRRGDVCGRVLVLLMNVRWRRAAVTRPRVSDCGLVGPTAPAAAPGSDRDDNQSPAPKYVNDVDNYPSSR